MANFLLDITRYLGSLVFRTPLYPHWLEFRQTKRGDDYLVSKAKGLVLEIGCGNKEFSSKKFEAVTGQETYIGLDYPGWRANFDKHFQASQKLGAAREIFFGELKPSVDIYADGNKLPFRDRSFDTVASFSVLEHILTPDTFSKEISRVLKDGGGVLLSVPFVYEEHSSFDCFRYCEIGLKHILESNGLRVAEFLSFAGFGCTLAQLINSFVISHVIKLYETNSKLRIYLFGAACSMAFALVNLLGFLIDLFFKDKRYSSRFHIIAIKEEPRPER